jgi:hypothetical protein
MYSDIHVFMCAHTRICMPFLWETGHWMPGHLLSFGMRWAMTSTHNLWNVLALIWKNFTLPVWAARRTSASCCGWKLQLARQHMWPEITMYFNVHYICLCSFEESELSLQGKVMSLFHVQDYLRWRRLSRQQFLWNVITCLWYHITEDSYLHGHSCDSHKSHIDHGHLAFFVYLSFSVNLPVINLWAVHARCSINKAKCRIWEIINSVPPLLFPIFAILLCFIL